MKPKESGKERRKSPRLKTRKLISAEWGGKQSALGDLSVTGAFVRTNHPLEVGKELELRLVGGRMARPVGLKAATRHSEPGYGMGVEFTEFHGEDQRELESFLVRLAVPRILVVDDNEDIRRVLKLALEREKYDVLTAADGVEGLQKALDSRPDLIVLDLTMPGLSGLEVCQRLRASPDLANVPVLILSATTDLADVSSAQKLGAMFVPKPFQPQKLLVHVRMLLER
ncbi:MAG: response regulator [Acidobacteria bacterium]|nr:response regulator [Acidobacteriota bacterium]